ncbi:MAG: hypothetical protein KGI56_10095 [Acidobacteriota bacterium]|nr:hypothetical protein [Acidobacteriota bacterium]
MHLPPEATASAPVLVLFDPGGDAAGALRRVAPAGDANGVVLVASTAFRNGLDDAAYARMLSDLKAVLARRFPDSPIWSGGFSGGARMSVGWAQQERGWIRGVVCFGAFYDRGGLPPGGTRVFLACGTGDFDWEEMGRAREALMRSGYKVVWRAFPGGHQWPPREVIQAALRFVAAGTEVRVPTVAGPRSADEGPGQK